MDSGYGSKGGKRGRGERERGGEDMPQDRVRKVLFGSSFGRARVDIPTSGSVSEPATRRVLHGVAEGTGNARNGHERVQLTRNDGGFEKKYTKDTFVEMLKSYPGRELELLQSLSYEDLIHEAMTNVFRGGFGFLVAVQKMRVVVLANRRLRAENQEVTKKFIEKSKELNKVLGEKIILFETNCKQGFELNNAQYIIGKLEAELKEWKESHNNLLDYFDHLDDHLREIREGMKPKYFCENCKVFTSLEGEKDLDLNVSTGDVK